MNEAELFRERLRTIPLDWLLAPDNPSARYLTLTDLLGHPADDPEVQAAQAAIPGWGPAKAILDAQWPEGYWMHPGTGYSPRHKATVWQVIFLAQLGIPRIEAVDRACAYVLDHNLSPDGLFIANRTSKGASLCLSGSLLSAFWQLGYPDPRLEESLEALAGVTIRNGFRCSCNACPSPPRHHDKLPCVWGAVKTLSAIAEVPVTCRSPAMQVAVEAGVALLLNDDPIASDYAADPQAGGLSFPLGCNSDLLELLEVLERLGVRGDPGLEAARAAVRTKQDEAGRWPLEHTPANTWASFGTVGQPNKWVTLRALRVLKRAGIEA